MAEEPVKGTEMIDREFGNYVIHIYQSQDVYNLRDKVRLFLVKSVIPLPDIEKSVFDGLGND